MINFLHAHFEQICKKPEPFRRDEWILLVRELSRRVPRGPYAIWELFSGCVAQKCEGFLNISELLASVNKNLKNRLANLNVSIPRSLVQDGWV